MTASEDQFTRVEHALKRVRSNRNRRLNEYEDDDWNFIFSFLLVVFTGVLAISTIALWCTTRKAAKAAKDSATAAVSTSIPVLSPLIINMNALHPLHGINQTFYHDCKLLINFENYRKTPGIIRQVRAELFL